MSVCLAISCSMCDNNGSVLVG